MADDSFISLRYSDRLLEGKGLTWTDHERVEGYSNLLWVLLVAALSGITPLDLVAAARLGGLAGMLGAVAALLAVDHGIELRAAIARVGASLVLALSAPIAVWAIGGLEQALVAPLLAMGLLGARRCALNPRPDRRAWVLPGVSLGLLCLTRPDSPLFVGAVALGIFLARGPGGHSLLLAARVCVLPVLLTLAQLLFRRVYYDDWVPNTAYAKVSFTTVRLVEGLQYLLSAAKAMPVLVVALLGGLLLLATDRRRQVLVLLPSFIAWSAYVAVIGGDIFPAYRHVIPLLVIAAFLLVVALEYLAGLARGPVLAATAAGGLAVLAFFPAHRAPEVVRANHERWEWDGQAVGEFFRAAFGDKQPLLAADPAGCLPFFSRLPSLDMLGLNDRFLARHPPPDFGRGPLAHELGNGAYVLSRKPDLVVFCLPLGSASPCFRGGRELARNPEFRRAYRLVRMQTLPPVVKTTLSWVRVEGRLGVQRHPDHILVPGLVLSGRSPLLNRLGPDGRMRTIVTDRQAARMGKLWLPAGRWKITADVGGDLLIRARSEYAATGEEGIGSVTLSVPIDGWVKLEAAALPGQTRELVAIELRRS